MLKRLKGLKHVTPGGWQAGPPRRSDGCSLGVAFACAVGRSAKLLQSCKRLKPFKRLRPGKRQLGRPEEAIDVALGCPLLRKTSSTPAVVPGAAPALAKAGVGGFFISHLASGLRTRRFSEPTFRPSGAISQSLEKHSFSRLSYLVAHLDLLS